MLENVPTGYSIVRVQAYDADEGPNAEIKYALSPRDATGGSTEDFPLGVDSHSGWIYTTKELDREEQPKYMFQVRRFFNFYSFVQQNWKKFCIISVYQGFTYRYSHKYKKYGTRFPENGTSDCNRRIASSCWLGKISLCCVKF